MLYFGASFLVPLLLPEATSDTVAEFVRGLPSDPFPVSDWTRVEFSSLVAREVRMGGLDAHTAARLDVRFEAMVEESFAVPLPNADDFGRARTFLGNHDTGPPLSPPRATRYVG